MRKKLFYLGVGLLALFELANVWFIMPLPFSQRMRSIDAAYFLYTWRWAFRLGVGALILAGLRPAWRGPGWSRWLAPTSLALVAGLAYVTNFQMSADRMFVMPRRLDMAPAATNRV